VDDSISLPAIRAGQKPQIHSFQAEPTAVCPAACAAGTGQAEASPAGLVPLQQVRRGIGDPLNVDAREARLKRMKRSTLTSARLMQEQIQTGGYRWKPAMLTPTYRDDVEWAPRHLSACLEAIQAYARRNFGQPLPYLWVGELTKRGRLHYHVIFWLPRGRTLPKPDKRGWWPHGSTRIEWVKSAIGYIAKYASKGESDGAFPKGARICGTGGLRGELRQVKSWWMLPSWLRAICTHDERFARAPGGGWMSRETGAWIASPYMLIGLSPEGARIQQVSALPEPLLCPFR